MSAPEIKPLALPHTNLPKGDRTVRVRAIDTTTRLVCDAFAFVQPPQAGHEKVNMDTMCFLLEHEKADGSSEHILFDCGARVDFWNGPPQARRMIGGHVPGLVVERGVDQILTDSGFDLANLQAIVWSHWHWDHVGDASKFPASTDLVVGPGFTENFVPGYPEDPNGFVLARDMEGHKLVEPKFKLVVGGYPAHDYFGDGSFYLLDVPGHAIGHICGFARTTPDTFVLLGADCCHFAGLIRPTPYAPMPSQIPDGILDSYYPNRCPCLVFEKVHAIANQRAEATSKFRRTTPFYDVSRAPGSAYTNGDLAQKSVDKLQPLDAHPDVLICLAHDSKLMSLFPLFNNDPQSSINDWKQWQVKERTRWDFLNELPRGSKAGREPFLDGVYRDGVKLAWTEDKGFHGPEDQQQP